MIKKISRNYFYAFKIMMQSVPAFTITNLVFCVLRSALDSFTMVYTFRVIISAFEQKRPYSSAIAFLITLFLVNLLANFGDAFFAKKYRPVQMKRLQSSVEGELFAICRTAELKKFDVPEFYQDVNWALMHGVEYIEKTYENCENFCRALASMCSLFLIIFFIDYFALFLVLLTVVISVCMLIKVNAVSYDQDMKLIRSEHRIEYIDKLFFEKKFHNEIRVYGFGKFFRNQFTSESQKALEVVEHYGKRKCVLEFVRSFFFDSFPIYILYTAYLIWQVCVSHVFSLADFASLFTSIDVLKNNLIWFSALISESEKNSLYIEKLKNIMLAPEKGDRQEAAWNILGFEKVAFHKVAFSYTGSDPVLEEVSFSISKGEKIAIVGGNGEGKTTILKLLLGLYKPDQGKIFCNGREISSFLCDNHFFNVSCVFQDSHLLPVSIAENISLSSTYDERKVLDALSQCGLKSYVDSLENGIHTMITDEYTEENGVGVSGGQAQKIALARALYQEADLIILDEPSSAMDPMSEYEFNLLLRNLPKTLIIISHRLSATGFVDKILLLQSGKILEEGNHAELMAAKGKYYDMYHAQALRYKDLSET